MSTIDQGDEPVLIIAGAESVDPASGAEANRKFRDALGQFATGVTCMTTLGPNGENIGVTVNSFSSLSLNPPLILWSIARTASAWGSFQVGDPFAVNVIAREQHVLAKQFARTSGDKFVGVEFYRGLDRVPLLAGCVVYLECVTEARYPGGDHEIVVGRVRRLFNVGIAPLLFHRGAFHLLGDPAVAAS